jgi:hypothetical protein
MTCMKAGCETRKSLFWRIWHKWEGNFKIHFSKMVGLCEVTNWLRFVVNYPVFNEVMTFRLC